MEQLAKLTRLYIERKLIELGEGIGQDSNQISPYGLAGYKDRYIFLLYFLVIFSLTKRVESDKNTYLTREEIVPIVER